MEVHSRALSGGMQAAAALPGNDKAFYVGYARTLAARFPRLFTKSAGRVRVRTTR